MSFVNSIFISSHTIFMSCTSFPCLIALTTTSNTMSNRSGECGHSHGALDLWGRKDSVSIIKCVSCGFFIDTLYQIDKVHFLNLVIYLRGREREKEIQGERDRMIKRGAEREGEREYEAGSVLTVESNVGLEFQIMGLWPKLKSGA